MPKTRKEKDSLGNIEVPARAYYGAQTARAVHNYPISGMRAHSLLIRAIGMVKRAAAETNKKLGLVDAHRADAISQAAQEVIDGKWDEEFLVDVFQAGAGVSFHMNANEVIANRANQISRRQARRVCPRPSQRPCELRPVHQRCFSHRHAPGNFAGARRSVPRARFAGRHLREKSQRIRQHPQVRPHASAGCRPDSSRPGICRLRRRHPQNASQHRAAVRLLARTRPRRLRRRHRHQHTSAIPRASDRAPGKALRPKTYPRPRHALGDAVHRLHGRCQRRAAHARPRNHPHLKRPPPARLRPQHRPGGDRSAQPAARLLHHARQNQSRHGGARRHGQLPGDRQRHGRRLRRTGRPT